MRAFSRLLDRSSGTGLKGGQGSTYTQPVRRDRLSLRDPKVFVNVFFGWNNRPVRELRKLAAEVIRVKLDEYG
jgi:hypothetical protein